MAGPLRLVLVRRRRRSSMSPVSALRFPLYDGQVGILPGRAPLIGRLGYGELNVTHVDGSHTSYFVDGGFVQVKQGIVPLDRPSPHP